MVRKRSYVNIEQDLLDKGYRFEYEASDEALLEVLCSIIRLVDVRKQDFRIFPGEFVGREKGRHIVYVRDRD